ncbi:MAG: alpha-amylase family glycosyl hydrolase [Ignavibacteriaceae bacterium]
MKKLNLIIFLSLVTLFSQIIKTEGANLFVNNSSKETRQNAKKNILIQKKHLQDLDKFYSTKQLGAFILDNKTIFRLFAPQALEVNLYTFNKPEDEKGTSYPMVRDEDGVWEFVFNKTLDKIYYGFRLKNHPNEKIENKLLCIDPYSRAVTSFTTYFNPRKSLFINLPFDWEGDTWIEQDWRDLIIYEMHVRDMTVHPTSGVSQPGTYSGLTEKNKPGGLSYIKNLGVNTVELLPAMDFGRIEIPYKDSLHGRFNTWNSYERNHWGYMTAAFFAPEPYYSENSPNLEWNKWIGTSGRQITDFKNMVKAFHKEGIAVIMDVVYNHLSEYELGNLKEIDKEYYFRLNDKGHFIAESGCGNDLKTERPMVRRLIVESILFWMKEYHIDGFRFDLGKLIDWETIDEIIREARKINPYVVFVCEPWGGGYDPAGFSLRDWGSWNDQIRNGIKGENPDNGLGWIFGKWYGNNNSDRIKSYINGTLVRDKHGLFQRKEHAVNYLESHDGYTLGDFIRVALKNVDNHKVIKDVDAFQTLTPEQLKLNKLAALFLFSSQGMTMIHSGQEYARTKVIPHDIKHDQHRGKIDHNTYNKDNEVNYLNYDHANLNIELLNYYKGLIALRKQFPAFTRAAYEDITFFDVPHHPFALSFSLTYKGDDFYFIFNADSVKSHEFHLPTGDWQILASPEKVDLESKDYIKNKITLTSSEGYILKKK